VIYNAPQLQLSMSKPEEEPHEYQVYNLRV
jgi:hypothetical protein